MHRCEPESDTISKPDPIATGSDGLEHSSAESAELEGASADYLITHAYLGYLSDSYEKRQEEPLSTRFEKIRFPEGAARPKLKRKDSELSFSKSDLNKYVSNRKKGLAKKSHDWINRAAKALWDCTHGEISEKTMTALKDYTEKKYSSNSAHQKVLGFTKAYLTFLAKTRMDQRYRALDVYLEPSKALKVRKSMTGRIVRREDILEALNRIDAAEAEETIKAPKARNYRAFALLAAYTGLRPSTLERLTVGQLRAAVNEDKPMLHVLPEQEKNRTEHWVPIHSAVVPAVKAVLENDYSDKDDAAPFFMYNSLVNWLRHHQVPLPRVMDPSKAHMCLGDYRKFAEQFGDVIGWDENNRKYVLAHGMTGVEWEHYKNPQREDVYDRYMEAWKDVDLRQ
jgi:integrase